MIALAVFNSRIQVLQFAEYLRRTIGGAICGQSFTHRKGELQLPVSHQASGWRIVCNFQPPLPFYNLLPGAAPPRQRVNLFAQITGTLITAIHPHRYDRLIAITLNEGQYFLILQLFGVNGNVLLYDAQRQLSATFKKVKKEPVIDWENFGEVRPFYPSWEQFQQACEAKPDLPLREFLNQEPFGLFSKTFLSECTRRLQCPATTPIGLLSREARQELFALLTELFRTVANPSFYLYPTEPPLLSFLRLQTPALPEPTVFADYSTAVGAFVSADYHAERLNRRKEELKRKISSRQANLTRKLQKQQQELRQLASANDYRRKGDLIMVHLNQLTKGATTVMLPLGEGEQATTLTIELDPRLSPVENAQRFYHRARREKEARRHLTTSLATTQSQLRQLQVLAQALDSGADLKQIEAQARHLIIDNYESIGANAPRQPYYQFQYADWQILVGKSAGDNDLLTHSLARPHDWWFHAQNVTGSHVLVRNPTKKDLPHALIVRAAAIAAFYSRARHSQLVPVIYALKKYVSKPRNSPPGTAAVKYEKVILVEPWNPKEESNS